MCLLGLLGLRNFEARDADIADLGEEHGHRVLRVVGKGCQIVLIPLRRRSPELSNEPWATGGAGRSRSTTPNAGWTVTPPPAAAPSRGRGE